MVYTGKLPLGKHNVSRIAAAADSLQMFDVAVGFKNVLTTLVSQQAPNPVLSIQTPQTTDTIRAESTTSEGSDCSSKDRMSTDLKKEHDNKDNEEVPACKRARVETSASSGQFQQLQNMVWRLINMH